MTGRASLALAAILGLATALPSCAAPTDTTPAPAAARGAAAKLGPCTQDDLPPDARCGTYEVWEDRAAKSGRKVPLYIVLLPATGPSPAPDPVLWLAGGPGDAASGAAGWIKYLAEIRKRRDFVFIDQRGSRTSNPLMCSLGGTDADLQSYLGDQFPVAEVRRCRAELEKHADLRLYTTAPAIDDFAEALAWLGYEKVNLFGGSYGTRAAQVFIRRHPDRVRSAVLLGVAPVDETLPISHSQAAQRALDLLFRACAAEPACGKAFPRLPEEFETVLERLGKEPAAATVRHPETHQKVAVRLPRPAFVEAVRFLMYEVGSARTVPSLVHQAYEGNYDRIAELAVTLRRGLRQQLAMGMLLSVTCAEDLPFLDPATIPERTRGSFLGDERVRQQYRACQDWPHGPVPPGHMEPVATDLPVLMFFGEMDPVTPPDFAARVAAKMPNSLQVMVPGGAHGNMAPCLAHLMQDFLDSATTRGLDTSCVAKIRQPPFQTSPPQEDRPAQ